MPTAERANDWTGPQLAAQWRARRAPQPSPNRYAIMRETSVDGRAPTMAYYAQDAAGTLDGPGFADWLASRGLGGADRLSLAVMTIREVLDRDGTLRECAIERRRGAVDGPFAGSPARVEFAGAARAVRAYAVDAAGALTEMPPAVARHSEAPELAEAFAGEEAALRARFGPGIVVLDRRSPTLFEETAGLSSIVHIRLGDREIGCGVGWFGPMAYVLAGGFPRHDHGIALPPADEAAVAAAIGAHELVRHETRLDDQGLCVIARRRDGIALFAIRPGASGGSARVESYEPSAARAGGADQRRWIAYARDHEAREPLDAYQDGASDELVVLTADARGQVWRHRIDADGVEVARGPANETAVATLFAMRRGGRDAADNPPAEVAAPAPAPGPQPTSSDDPMFDDALAEAFPEAAFDMDEAVACLALRRPTAAMQHAAAVARAVPALAQVWGAHPAGVDWRTAASAADGAFGAGSPAALALRALRRRWHAPTTAPAGKYTETEARWRWPP